MRKKQILLLLIIFLLLFVLISKWSLIYYGFKQARGQLSIIFNTVPVERVMEDPYFPDSLKYKIKLIQDVREYAVDSLGLEGARNYTTYYDQKGEELMWVVTACEPFKLEAYTWSFPLLGSFTYKGFFDPAMAEEEALKLKMKGYDTDVRNAGGWSTLGILKDPILSGMLGRPEGSLAELIIHELTHATIFIRDSIELNENLATFIGQEGAKAFLSFKYGKNSNEVKTYLIRLEDRNRFTDFVLRGAWQLDSLYSKISDSVPLEEKMRIKRKWMDSFVESSDTVLFHSKSHYSSYFKELEPNNTLFMSYLRYRGGISFFQEELDNRYQGDVRDYIFDLKKEYEP